MPTRSGDDAQVTVMAIHPSLRRVPGSILTRSEPDICERGFAHASALQRSR